MPSNEMANSLYYTRLHGNRIHDPGLHLKGNWPWSFRNCFTLITFYRWHLGDFLPRNRGKCSSTDLHMFHVGHVFTGKVEKVVGL